jgi:hypothetical protein
MKLSRSIRYLTLLLAIFIAAGGAAQEAEDSATPEAPDFSSLQTNWWSYFEGSREEVEPRAEAFFEGVEVQIADLAAQNQEIAQSVLVAVRDNIATYLTLFDDTEPAPQDLPPPAVSYSIEDLLVLAATARDALSDAAEEQLEVERERRVLNGATRRRDAAFKDYVDAAAGDERWLVALRLIQARSAQEISERRLELLSQRFERATAYAEEASTHVDLARELLAATTSSTELNDRVIAYEEAVESARTEQSGCNSRDFWRRKFIWPWPKSLWPVPTRSIGGRCSSSILLLMLR